ncbi:MAG: hypothetical protein AAFP19_17065 [Bacteroidota bacterium]
MNWIFHLREQVLILLVERTKPIYTQLFKRQQVAWKISRQQLRSYPPDSLGYELGDFLYQQDIDLIPKLEDHDVMHVLFKYQTTVVDEARMQFFLLGNGKRSLYALCTALIALVLIPEHYSTYWQEFQKGRHCLNISKWDFQHLLSEPLELLRLQIKKQDLGEEAPLYM